VTRKLSCSLFCAPSSRTGLSVEQSHRAKILGSISAQQLVKRLQNRSGRQNRKSCYLKKIETELESENIFIINENEISVEQEIYLKDFFIQKLSPELVTIILNDLSEFPLLRDNMGYLAIKLVMKTQVRYAIIEIPKR
jgi:polyphosphate kinase